MRRIAIAVLAATALSAGTIETVSAQDLLRMMYAPTSVANWTGFYIGGNAGYGWARDEATATSTLPGQAQSSFSMKGMIAGGQIGANVQVGRWVLGIESDFQGSLQKLDGPGNATVLTGSVGFPAPGAETTRMDWFGTTRVRAGVAAQQVLFYGTAGVAYASIRTQGITSGISIVDSSPVKIGWAAGGGIEVMLSRNWTLKGEYLHLDFGGSSDTYSTLGGAVTAELHQQITDDIVRVGVNYMFR